MFALLHPPGRCGLLRDSTGSSSQSALLLAELVAMARPACRAARSPGSASSAERPADSQYIFAFYNIGWVAESRKHTPQNLGTEILALVEERGIHALGLCEVFDLKDNKPELQEKRAEATECVLSALNSSVSGSSAERPALWASKTDGHYIFVWNSRALELDDYAYISCGIADHPWRKAQYLRFRPADSGRNERPVHVMHNHSPSTSRCKLTSACRQLIFKNLWGYVMKLTNEPQPVCIFGGDFNCNPSQWAQFIGKDARQMSMGDVRLCGSCGQPPHDGDRAGVFNAEARQVDSRWGKRYPRANELPPFTDCHDVVMVLFQWPVLAGEWWNFVHCATCRLEWKLPDPPAGCCTKCGGRVAEGKCDSERAAARTRMANVGVRMTIAYTAA